MSRVYGIYSRVTGKLSSLRLCTWNRNNFTVDKREIYCNTADIPVLVAKHGYVIVNITIRSSNRCIHYRDYKDTMSLIKMVAGTVRKAMISEYGDGTNLCGHCIEASEILQTLYSWLGIKSKTVEGWCEFDDEYYGSDRPYDPHTWLEIPNSSGAPLYVDVTADQFNAGMFSENRYPGMIINLGLPHGMTYSEPVVYD